MKFKNNIHSIPTVSFSLGVFSLFFFFVLFVFFFPQLILLRTLHIFLFHPNGFSRKNVGQIEERQPIYCILFFLFSLFFIIFIFCFNPFSLIVFGCSDLKIEENENTYDNREILFYSLLWLTTTNLTRNKEREQEQNRNKRANGQKINIIYNDAFSNHFLWLMFDKSIYRMSCFSPDETLFSLSLSLSALIRLLFETVRRIPCNYIQNTLFDALSIMVDCDICIHKFTTPVTMTTVNPVTKIRNMYITSKWNKSDREELWNLKINMLQWAYRVLRMNGRQVDRWPACARMPSLNLITKLK